MVRPSTPVTKHEGGESRAMVPRIRTPLSSKSTHRFKSFMGASRENLGFAFLNEKRIARRYLSRKMKRTKSMLIGDSVNNIFDVTKTDNSKSKNESDTPQQSAVKEEDEEKPRIEIDYDNLAEERKSKFEELKQEQHMDEKEVQKRKKKRKKLTKRLKEKTKNGQPRMGNHVAHLLSKIQHVTNKK